MIGLIAAMELEMEGLRALMTTPVTTQIAGIDFVSGLLEGQEVVTAVSGIGKVSAAMCAQAMISAFQPSAVICTGVAGSLSEKLSIGSIAVASGVVQHDLDTTVFGDPLGYLSKPGLVEIPTDASLRARLTACAGTLGIETAEGVIASGDQFISSAEKKAFLSSHFGAIACEMEGAAIGQVCYLNHVPFCVLRAISDNADGSSDMDYPVFARTAAARSVELLRTFLRS